MEYFTLSNGLPIPAVGYGTYKTAEGDPRLPGPFADHKIRQLPTSSFFLSSLSHTSPGV